MSDFLADFMPIGQFAKNVRKHVRTVYRWTDEPSGLPYTRLGNQRLIHLATAHAWLMQRMHQPNPDRRRRRRR
jgi:excisionase family DNA binding protein